jgi:hypothetical protein
VVLGRSVAARCRDFPRRMGGLGFPGYGANIARSEKRQSNFLPTENLFVSAAFQSVGGRSQQNHWSGEFRCAEQLHHIAVTPQFVSSIFGADFTGFCRAATASITVIDERIGPLLSSRKPACLSSARYSDSVRSRPLSITIMLRSLNGANPGSPISPRSHSITMSRPLGRIARRQFSRMRMHWSSSQSCRICLSR